MEVAPKVDDVDSDEEENTQKVTKAEEKEAEVAEDTTLTNSDVVTKYQEAAKIVQATLLHVSSLCIVGARILDICRAGDAFIEEKASLIFKGKGKSGKVVEKGIAFPVCVSVNEFVCHVSPLASEDTFNPLAAGDLVKLDLGAHVDGYIAVAAHTLIVPGLEPPAPITGPRANVLAAAWAAAEVAARLIRPGNSNAQVTEAIKKVADAYNVKPIAGTVMHEMKRYVIDGKKVILLKEDGEHKVDPCKFEAFEVYSVDVAVSSGEGKPRDAGVRTTVLKRQVDRKYGLKVSSSRKFFNEVSRRFPTMPFSLRNLPDEREAKLGVRECVLHELLQAYPVLQERTGDQVAHVKFTVLLLSGGTVKITGLEIPNGVLTPDVVLPAEITALLAPPVGGDSSSAKKKKKKAAKKAGGGGAAEEATSTAEESA